MAKDKNSFTAYCDWGNVFDELTDEQAGKLVKHLFDYVRDRNPEAKDPTTKLLFIQIQATLKRDLKKWEAVREKNRQNGLKGGRPQKPTEPKKPNGLNGNPKEPKKAVRDSVSVSVSDSEIIDIGDKSLKRFVIVNSNYVGQPKYRLYGVDGIVEFIEQVNQSTWDMNPELANKFLRDKVGQVFNDFDHIIKSYNVFVKNQFK